ncbi:MAG: FtsX-like permease family protein [Elusimicrobiota bacterium]
MMLIKLAWRNIFRNKRRTIITGIAIGVGLASLIFVDALIIGMEENMIKSATASFLGEGQIHARNFRQTGEVEKTINNLNRVAADLAKEKIVQYFSLRVMSFGMITSPSNVSALNLVGINPENEKYLSQIDETISKGTYFQSGKEREIVIGTKLAEILEVGLGERVVVTVAQAKTGNLTQEMFRVSGIYHFNIDEMDRGMAFVRLPKAQEMFGLDGEVHEIAIKFVDPKYGRDESLAFWNKYSQGGNEAAGWTIFLPQLKAAFEFSSFSTYIIGVILFGIIALGIVNTLFMSLYERMFEFGVLRALGTRPFSIARLIVWEAGALAIVSISLGVILGFLINCLTAYTGIDYTGIEYAGVTVRELIYPVLKVKQFIIYPLWVFIFTVVVGIYPAVYAARMPPVEAMKRSL